MDPLTIATGVISLGKLCSKLFTFIRDMNLVDERVNVLAIEIDSLKTVLVAIANIFNDPDQAGATLSTPIALQHWQNVNQMLQNCKDTLTDFEGIVENIKRPEFRVARKPAKMIALANKEGQLTSIKEKLTTYRVMLTMSLQSVTLFDANLFPSNVF